MGFFNELWYKKRNSVKGEGVAILVLLGIYFSLLKTYK